MRSGAYAARAWALAGLGLVVAACAAAPPGTARRAIAGGADDAADPAVVALATIEGATWCTGTLVAPRVVLTAAHCGFDEINVFDYRAVFGSDVASGQVVGLVDARSHPGWDPASGANDFALVHLAEVAPAAPVTLFAGPLDDTFLGQSVRLVGFGLTAMDADDAGRKRQGTATISSVDATTIRVAPGPALPCMHDSGGPAFLTVAGTEYLAGVVWSGDTACLDHGVYGRADTMIESFLQPYLASTGPGAAQVGERCFYPEHCATDRCVAAVDDARITYCSRACAGDADCPEPLRCAKVDEARECRYPLPTPRAPGAACAGASECLDECVADLGRCAARCVPLGADACPAGFACTRVGESVDFFCLAEPRGDGCGLTAAPPRRAPLLAALLLALLAARRATTRPARRPAPPRPR